MLRIVTPETIRPVGPFLQLPKLCPFGSSVVTCTKLGDCRSLVLEGVVALYSNLRGCLKSRLRVTDHGRLMPITSNTDKLYDTDLTDAAWALIGPMLPAARRGGRPRTTNIRAVLNAIFYLLRTGCQWRLLPKCFQSGARSIASSEPGRTVVSGLASSAQCASKLDGKPVGPPVRRSSSWMASR